jgi:hypothetical protein
MGFIGVDNAGMITAAAIIMVVRHLSYSLLSRILLPDGGLHKSAAWCRTGRYRDLKSMVSWFIGQPVPAAARPVRATRKASSGPPRAASPSCVTSDPLVPGGRGAPAGVVINFALVNHSAGAAAMGFVVVFWHFFHAHWSSPSRWTRPCTGGLPLEDAHEQQPITSASSQGKLDEVLVAPSARRRMKIRRGLVDHHRSGALPVGGVLHLRRVGHVQLDHLVLRVNSFTRTGTLMRAGTSSHEPR